MSDRRSTAAPRPGSAVLDLAVPALSAAGRPADATAARFRGRTP